MANQNNEYSPVNKQKLRSKKYTGFYHVLQNQYKNLFSINTDKNNLLILSSAVPPSKVISNNVLNIFQNDRELVEIF